ncbi:MAG: tRNA1(Val) (adenine(37)-N6)-methyltransferase [Bacteroidota bacterium]
MSQSVFHFRHFTIHQDKCAMKVGTDAVLLGAWIHAAGSKRILDIGTGTGLIALMMAQKSNAQIDAIDIDQDASVQAAENFNDSLWSDRLNAISGPVQEYAKESIEQYDLIVSNPPYFMGAHPAPSEARNVARHMDEHLSIEELVEAVHRLLTENGRFCIILPYIEGSRFKSYASEHGLYPTRITKVITKTGKTEKRVLMEFAKSIIDCQEDEIILQDELGNYTEQYRKLTTDFYPGM